MLAAHAAATLGCALLLARGEAALWALAAWLRPLVALPRPVTADADAPVPAAFPPAAVEQLLLAYELVGEELPLLRGAA